MQIGAAERDELGFQRSFIGKLGEGSETPAYTSENIVVNGDTLTTAVGKLDAEIGGSVTPASHTQAGQTVNQNIEALDAVLSDARTTNYLPDALTGAILCSVKVTEHHGFEADVVITSNADGSVKRVTTVKAFHNGSFSVEATSGDHYEIGTMNFNDGPTTTSLSVDLSGTGAAQVLRLVYNAAESCNVHVAFSKLGAMKQS